MIRHLVKYFLINIVTLYLISLFIKGMIFINGVNTIILTGIGLSLASMVIKPVINILLLPLNLVTFGLFRWVSYAVTLYIVTLIVPGFKIINFLFEGYKSYWISIPSLHFNGILALVIFSFVISVISSLLDWLLK